MRTIREKGGRDDALYLDIHHHVAGLTGEAIAGAHAKDLEVQDKYCIKYLRYWYDEGTGKVFCLCEAPSKEAAEAVHHEAHGLVGLMARFGERENSPSVLWFTRSGHQSNEGQTTRSSKEGEPSCTP